MSLITINGNVLDFISPQGKKTTFTSGTARFYLVLPPRSNKSPVDSKTGMTVPTHYDVPIQWDGKFQAKVESNDNIIPAGTVYSFMLMVPNVNHIPKFYSFHGPGPLDLRVVAPAPEQSIEVPDVPRLLLRIQELEAEVADLRIQLKRPA